MSKAAKAEELEALHAVVAQVLREQLTGEEVSPAMIAQAIKFLKDNGIEAAKGSNNKALNELADKVSRLSEDDPEALSELYN